MAAAKDWNHRPTPKGQEQINNIRRWRKQRGLTMQDLAERIGTSQQQIDRLEKGRRRLTVDWLVRLSQGLGCELLDLLPADVASSAPKTMRTKVIGSVGEEGSVAWLDKNQSYEIRVARIPALQKFPTFGLFMLQSQLGFPAGSELIFAEIAGATDLPESLQPTLGKVTICTDGPSENHRLHVISASNTAWPVKAVLIKAILNIA